MDVVISIAAKIAEYTVEPVGRWLCYSFQYGSNIENLKNRVKELEGPRDRVKHDIEAARRNAEEIETDVNAWLEKVDQIIQKAKEVLESEDKGSLRFANGECLNLKQRHQLSRKAKKIVQGVDDDKILEKGNFKRVSYRPAPERMVTSTYRNYLSFESRKSTMIELLAALKDTNINLIGVWGMGAVGKSMLVNEVARQAKEDKLFDEVAVADVTQHSDIRRIQGEIADTLDVKFDVETERGRARHLMERLTRDKKILVVLDDIWKRLDLEEIGIPCKGCQVVLISRNRDILRQLDTHRDFGLETLPQDEAWNLFEMMVGMSLQGPRFLDIATELAKKCAGLPIALTTVSNALKAKSLEIWKDALRQLERPTSEHLTEMQSTIYKSVRLEELQITDCINMVAIIVEEEGQKEEKHMVLFPKLRGLVLLNLPKLECFLSLQNSCTTNAGEIISKDKLDCYMQILHGKPVFSKLEKLELSSIHWGDVRQKKQEASSSCRFTSMPTISWFQSLVSLIVHGSGNIERLLSLSTAKSMVQLKSLEIRECNIMEEVLLTGDFGGVEEIIPNTLFPQLETLSLIELPFLKWFCKGSKIEFPSLKELKIEGCPKFMTFICKLDSSGMTVNKELMDRSANESSYSVIEPLFNEMVVFPKLEELRISHIVDLKRIWHDQFIENSFCKLQTLIIESCENLTNVFQAHVLARFQRLSRLKISDCESIQEVFELQGFNDEGTLAVTAIPLKWLILLELPKLQYVWSKDPHQIFTFQDLQEVYVRGCESLKSLFMASVARSLPQLEILSIHDCGVEEIVPREDEALAVDRLAFPRVTHLALRGLPRMEQFYPGLYTAEWPNLKKIWVQGCPFDPTLSSLEEEPEESHQETSNKKLYFMVDKAQAKCVDSMREFVEDINYSDRFPNPEELYVKSCGSMQQVFELQGLNVDESHIKTIIQLKILIMCGLPNLRHVWDKDPH